MMSYDDCIGAIREARAYLLDEQAQGKSSRELALVVTKLDEAEMWRERDLNKKNPKLVEDTQV